ncbi:uncharacterized, partial [Tachysurus ichikawai]
TQTICTVSMRTAKTLICGSKQKKRDVES